jgi:spoIIIJ-associated protein
MNLTKEGNMRYIEEEGKTPQEALEKALESSGILRSEARYQVMEEGGDGAPAKVRLYLDVEDFTLIEGVIREILTCMGVKAEIDITVERSVYHVNVDARRYDPMLIGKNGHTLDALAHIIGLIVKRRKPNLKVVFDVADYNKKKRQFTINKAIAVARRVKDTGMEMSLDPMTPEERRAIRSVLKKDKEVRVLAVGSGKDQTLVVAPAKR